MYAQPSKQYGKETGQTATLPRRSFIEDSRRMILRIITILGLRTIAIRRWRWRRLVIALLRLFLIFHLTKLINDKNILDDKIKYF